MTPWSNAVLSLLEWPALLAPTFPAVSQWWAKAAIVAAAYWVGMRFSGPLVKFFVLPPGALPPGARPDPRESGGVDAMLARVHRRATRPRLRYDAGAVIGKCENILTITLVLVGQFGGLGLIFTAKALARGDDIRREPSWFLGGTLVNLVWGLAVGMAARLLVVGP